MTRTILVTLDGSEQAETVLPWASLFARSRGDSLTLVRIVPWPTIPSGEFDAYMSPEVYEEILEAEEDAARSYLEHVKGELESQGIPTSTVIRQGIAAEGIHDVADELNAYALAMASHGRSGVARLVLGSVAERVLQQATLPVLLVRTGAIGRAPALSRLMVPLDGSALAERALDDAEALATADTALVLVRVVEPVYDLVAADDGVTVIDEVATRRDEAEAADYLARVAGGLRTAGYRVETIVRRGRAAEELLAALEPANVDMVLMTTHGHTGPARWLTGSVADEVFRHADRPVFVISVRTLTARAVGPFRVRDLMTRDVAYVQEDEPVIAVIRKLLRRQVSGAPVLNKKGELVGVVSEHDLLAWHAHLVDELSKSESSLDPAEYAQRIESEPVRRIMTHPPASIDESAELGDAVRVLLDRKMRRLAVTGDDGLVGVISRADVLKGMAARWESMASDDEKATE